jgi:beta-galactosidase/beta-glucuronidase
MGGKNMSIKRAEHPKPQFERDTWLNLNGEWEFDFDFSKSGIEKEKWKDSKFSKKITVPFCPESTLSGIGFTDFIPALWYKRTVTLSAEQVQGTVLLHFGAVDYETVVYVNSKQVGTHIGGYASFTLDITSAVIQGDNTVVVYAQDDIRSDLQPSGKQSHKLDSYSCLYTRTTGIWQTVWLEFTPKNYIKRIRVVPNTSLDAITLSAEIVGGGKATFSATALLSGTKVGQAKISTLEKNVTVTIPLSSSHLWSVEDPTLYDLELELETLSSKDIVHSYFGLRTISIENNAIYLNSKPVFQRLVLDQGFYPDGIYTAPDEETLIRDIKLSKSLGFNGARLHEKAFEERFIYHADRLGYLVWGEFPNWGMDHTTAANLAGFLPEWLSLVERDFNHPALIGWCPFNETWDKEGQRQDDNLLRCVYLATKAADSTRPVIDTSGNYHVITDIYDVHDYEQNIEEFSRRYEHLKKGEAYETIPDRQHYEGQPYFVSEYGGARWSTNDSEEAWGYGNAPKSEEEVIVRYEGLTGALLRSEGICAFCYTQLFDVEQEQNGLFTYDRQEKFSKASYERIRLTNIAKAAIEESGE